MAIPEVRLQAEGEAALTDLKGYMESKLRPKLARAAWF